MLVEPWLLGLFAVQRRAELLRTQMREAVAGELLAVGAEELLKQLEFQN